MSTAGTVTRRRVNPFENKQPVVNIPVDVVSILAAICDLKTLAALGQVCRAYAWVAHQDRRLRVHAIVKPFAGSVGDAIALLAQLEEVGGVITGWAAVKAMLPEVAAPNDLDIAVNSDMAEPVEEFFTIRGFQRIVDPQRRALHLGLYYPHTSHVRAITTFEHPTEHRRVEIIKTNKLFAIDAVLSHPNTLLHNCITSDFIISFHPQLTFAGVALSARDEPASKAYATQLRKYANRGFQVHANTSFLDGPCGSSCPLLLRSIRSPSVCVARYSHVRIEEKVRKIPPRTRRLQVFEYNPELEYRLGSTCANGACPHHNA